MLETDALAVNLAGTRYSRPFRRYQGLALEAFERTRTAGRRRLYVVLPPGGGKTVLGLEVARRLGQPALVLCPNTAVQAQWLRQWQDFAPATVEAGPNADLSAPITVLTYQALCVLDGEEEGLDARALDLWAHSLADGEGISQEEAVGRVQAMAAADNPHYLAERRRFQRRARDLVARGGDRAELLALLHSNGRDLVARLKAGGPRTLVLDECHHLLEMWGYLVRALVEELGEDTFVVGLTATPPAEMDAREAALYRDLFGEADFEVPTPALVKEGDLAPYQELALLVEPLAHEKAYVDAQQERFSALLGQLLSGECGSVPFPEWLHRRAWERSTAQGPRLSWAALERERPAFASAVLRYAYHAGLRPPGGARLAERHRREPTADDWVALIEDYCLHFLLHSQELADAELWQHIRHALPSLGYVLTGQGIRTYVSPVDRVLSLSASKGVAALEILTAERHALGPGLRALVLCDYERAGREVLAKLRGVLDPQAGSAALLLHLLLADPAGAALSPVLVTGRTVACSRETAATLIPWLEAQAPVLRGALTVDSLFSPAEGAAWDDVVALRPAVAWWRPRHYVPLLTRYFEEGHSLCLVGTRGLLGEGWDARSVNVLIDLTAASTSTAVHQMRGRSLRLDPALPQKVADNWDVVCADPSHPKGTADYARFVRKHRHYFGLTPEGEVESGVSHVHPGFSPYGPPEAARFGELNRSLLARVGDRTTAYARWRVGEPYANREANTVRIHHTRSMGLPLRRQPPRSGARVARLGGAGAGGLAAILLAGSAAGPLAALVAATFVVGAALAWGGWRRSAGLRTLAPADTLEAIAAAVHEALRTTGGIDAARQTSVRLALQADGYYRCYLTGATAEESQRFAESLDEALAPLAEPRYIIARRIVEAPRNWRESLAGLVSDLAPGHPGSVVVYHAVPSFLATNKQRARQFEAAWNRHVSPGAVIYCQHPRAQAILELQRGANPFEVTTQMRVLWE